MLKLRMLAAVIFFACGDGLLAQGNIHPQSETYEWPTDPLVKNKLAHWQDQKFGLLIHFGLYAVPGIIESWGLCSEPWVTRDSTQSYCDYKSWYWGLKDKFNPTAFNPDQWADAARTAGMRYVVFTTKHHDGFCLFNTRQTDFSIAHGPFAQNPKADLARFVFDAFRKKGFMIGAYFSKPDLHSENFWWPMYASPDRNTNYDIRKFPWRWNNFKQFTYNQIQELMTGYGAMDILWLDGGWVRPRSTVTEEVKSWGAAIPEWSQDIDMPRIAAMARKEQPGLLIVDRTVHGPYENYQTPEQTIPASPQDHPWESCITLGNAWGFVPNDHLKSVATIIHTLVKVVARGGSLLLGIGPKPDGTLPLPVVDSLAKIGSWLTINGKAIYATRPASPASDGEVFFTRAKTGDSCYAICLLRENGALPESIGWSGNLPSKGTRMILLATGTTVTWKLVSGRVTVTLPSSVRNTLPGIPALAFSFQNNDGNSNKVVNQ